jgi:hypothetical protein
MPACRQHPALPEGFVMGRFGSACRRFVRYYRNPVFRAFFHAPPENRLGRDRHTRLATAAILSRSAGRSRLPDLLLCSSGLLIRGFGVQVPGGAPVLTWGFIAPGHFLCVRFVPMFAPCLLACTDRAIRGLSKTAHPAPDPGHAPASRAVSDGRRRSGLTREAAPNSLDQWSRPLRRALGTCLDTPCRYRHAA